MSSFASELEHRFNIRDSEMMGYGMGSDTDPRIIQAITQTLIGEYLWKYTRKAGRGEMTKNRHRRFFWVHPYTRTLYWSEQDPATAGKAQLKAKSVQIEAVRVVQDDNPNPPGLHRKSLVVMTPGRDVKFTAATGQRHETWFNALSYLLLRQNSDARYAIKAVEQAVSDDPLELNTTGTMLDVSRNSTVAPRASFSTYNSRSQAAGGGGGGRRSRGSSFNADFGGQGAEYSTPSTVRRTTLNPSYAAGVETLGRSPTGRSHRARASISSRISNILRPGRRRSASQNSFSRQGIVEGMRGTGGVVGADQHIYDASVVSGSAEDLRGVYAGQEGQAERLENVRACCDGEFFLLRGLRREVC